MSVTDVATKAPVWDEALVNIDVLIEEWAVQTVGVGVLVSAVIIVLEFAVTTFDVLIDVLLLPGKIIDVSTDVGFDAWVNVLVATMTVLEFDMTSSLYEFSCCAEFDCRSMALSNFTSVLHAWTPSYHV